MIFAFAFAFLIGLAPNAFAVTCPAGGPTSCATLSGDGTLATGGVLTVSAIGGKAVSLGAALTTSGTAATTLAFPSTGTPTFTFPTASKTLAATDWSNMGSMPTSGDLMLSAGNDAAPTAYGGTSCTNQALTALSAAGGGTCNSITSAFISGSITAAQMLALATGDVYQGNGSNQPAAVTMSAAIDAAIGSTRGSILERGSGGWALLTPSSTSGFVLTSNGTGADPSYQASAGGSTTVNLAPGLGSSQTTFNGTGSAQSVTGGSTLYPQAASVAKTGAYTLNADCSTGALALCDTARVILADGAASIAITAPNPAGTLAPYQIADEAGHGFTVPTVGGTATFVGCVTGSPTTLTVPAGMAVQLFDQGSGANTYFCSLQPSSYTPNGNTLKLATVSGSLTSRDIILADGNGNIVDGGSGIPTLIPVPIVGNWYTLYSPSVSTATSSASAGTTTVYCSAGFAGATMTVEALGITIVGVGTTNLQLALYASGSWGRPGTLLSHTASIVDTSAASVSAALAANQQIIANQTYWVCVQVDDTSATWRGVSASARTGAAVYGSATLGNVIGSTGIDGVSATGGAFGSWGNFTSGTTWTDDTGNRAPFIALEPASVP